MNRSLRVILLIITLFIWPVSASDEIKIGAIFAKTGQAAEDNQVLFESVRFATDEINSLGGVLGKKIRLIEYDNHSTPIQSLLAAKQAVRDGVLAVIGASWSDHSMVIAPYLQSKKVPMITPDSTNPKITKIGDYIFRTCVSEPYLGRVLANFAYEHFAGHRAIILQNVHSDYSVGLSDVFERHYESLGGVISLVLKYKSDQTKFVPLLKQVKTLAPDVLFISGHEESGYIVKQAREMGINAKFIGGDTWSHDAFYSLGGNTLDEGYYASHWDKNLNTLESLAFVERYRQAHQLSNFVAEGYDAAMMLFAAITRANSLDRKAIRDQIAATENFMGISGNITLDKNGDAIKPMLMMKINNGKADILTTVQPN
ncbi:ABC transporter substrate-binding protein [Vibrio sp. WJH972]